MTIEARLMKQVDDLQAANTRLLIENRALKAELAQRAGLMAATGMQDRRADVMAFFGIAGQEIGSAPHIPSDDVVRFRLGLIAEEFIELLDASLSSIVLDRFDGALMKAIMTDPIAVDLEAFVDATVDLDYVVEGARVAFGINGAPHWDEVHSKNLEKRGGPKCPETGKHLKPEGWTGPDHRRLLLAQGWRP